MNHVTSEQMALYLDGMLDAREAVAFHEHLAGCRACAEAIATMRAIEAAARRIPDVLPDPAFTRRVMDEVAALPPHGSSVHASSGRLRRFPGPRTQQWPVAAAVCMLLLLLAGAALMPSSPDSASTAGSIARAFDSLLRFCQRPMVIAGAMASATVGLLLVLDTFLAGKFPRLPHRRRHS